MALPGWSWRAAVLLLLMLCTNFHFLGCCFFSAETGVCGMSLMKGLLPRVNEALAFLFFAIAKFCSQGKRAAGHNG